MTAMAPVRLFYSTVEAGQLLGRSDEAVRQMIRRGDLHVERSGRNYRIPRVELERLGGAKLGPGREDLDSKRAQRELIRQIRIKQAEIDILLAQLEEA